MVEPTTDRRSATVPLDWRAWSDEDYDNALAELEPIFNASVGTPESIRADVLFDAIEAYEESRHQITNWLAKPSTPEAIAEYEATKRGDPVRINS